MYPSPQEPENMDRSVVRYLCYTDSDGNGFLKGKGEWKPFDMGVDEVEDAIWLNVDNGFVDIFEKARKDGETLYLEDAAEYFTENENYIV